MKDPVSKSIFLVCDTAKGGGAERILTYIVNGLDREKFEPTLVLFRREIGYPIQAGTAIEVLDEKRSHFFVEKVIVLFSFLFSIVPRSEKEKRVEDYYYFKTILKSIIFGILSFGKKIKKAKPNLVIVFLEKPIIVALITSFLFRLDIPIICSDRVLLSKELSSRKFPRINMWVLKLLFRRSAGFVAVSEQSRQDLIKNFGVPPEKTMTIYNGIDIDRSIQLAGDPLDGAEETFFSPEHFHFAALGRLSKQKNFTALISAFARVRKVVAGRLLIIGDGELRGELETLVSTLALENDVVFCGWLENPLKIMARADVFVLSSDYEGFPNAMLEAMAVGLPVVSTDCPSGPYELLEGGKYGLLVPCKDEEALASAMERMAIDSSLRRQMAELAGSRVAEFDLAKMIDRYESLCERASAC